MSAEKASAIVLKLVDFSETSSVVTLLTREFGRISALAKGAHRLKGPFDSALDLLTLCRIVFLRKSSGLDLLTESKLEWRFRPPCNELHPLYAGYYLTELVLSLTDDHDPHPELFDLTEAALKALADGKAVAPVVLRFELLAFRTLGHLPNFDACVQCGEPVAAEGRIAFGQLAGGVLCSKCRPGKRQVISMSASVLSVLRVFADPQNETWSSLLNDTKARGELRAIVNHYVQNLLGRKLRMRDYLKFLSSE